MILSDKQIKEEINKGEITLSPFNEKLLNPTSYDVTLDYDVMMYIPNNKWIKILDKVHIYFGFNAMYFLLRLLQNFVILNCRKKPITYKFEIPTKGMIIYPKYFYLYSIVEKVGSIKYSSEIKSKSSIARLGLLIHYVASWIDVGFIGNITLEMSSTLPLRVYPLQKIGQLIFHTINGEVEERYDEKSTSKYNNQVGVTASKMYKNE